MNNKQNIRVDKTIKLFLFILLFSLSHSVKAQSNLPYVDDKPIHFGFLLGGSLADFSVETSESRIAAGISDVRVSRLLLGFTAGFIADLRLNRYFNLRFTPQVFFTERELSYRKLERGEIDKEFVFSIPFAMPVYLKYSAEREGNYRPYLIAGGGAYVDFARNNEKNVLLNPFDLYVDIGVGCTIYFSFFRLSPELKFSVGFNNMLTSVEDRSSGGFDPKYTKSISGLTSKMLTLSFNFE